MKFSTVVSGVKWAGVYDRAIRDDGSLLFPQKLSREFLESQRKAQGSYIFAFQYQNEIIPGEDQDFKKSWLQYYTDLPQTKNTFCFIDPAISLEDHACYTAVVVVDVDPQGMWYLKVARRVRITATQTIELIFNIHKVFKPMVIGIEIVAYQEALMHFMAEEMRKRGVTVPVHGVRRSGEQSKMMRIRSLVPRFEWQRIMIKPGLNEFEDEYLKFPRGTYVDILDALSSLEEITFNPELNKEGSRAPNANHPDYEKYYISQLLAKKSRETEGMEES